MTVPRGYLVLSESAAEKRPPVVDDPYGCVDPETLAHVAETARTPTDMTPERLAAFRKRVTTREDIAAANLERVVAAGIPVAMGTDAGNPLTLHGPAVYAEMEAMQRAGMT